MEIAVRGITVFRVELIEVLRKAGTARIGTIPVMPATGSDPRYQLLCTTSVAGELPVFVNVKSRFPLSEITASAVEL